MKSAGALSPWVVSKASPRSRSAFTVVSGASLPATRPSAFGNQRLAGSDDRLAGAPAVLGEVVRDARDDVGPAAPEVALAVAVAVHRVGAVAARHELRRAHRAGVGALHRRDVELFLAREQQELLELGAEVARARRVVESERRERVHDAELAGDAAEEGLGAEDADDHVRRDARVLRDRGDVVAMLGPERDAGVDALGGQEVVAVRVPGHHGLGGLAS